ncbi:MAG: NAD(P)/FAD-dependent oxidoreductase [Candidatus Omnitrophica bacterium]|nr:NAD(P)/FAD-dependent oxidoreductase [Candidatus Omnitrophota bacterium]
MDKVDVIVIGAGVVGLAVGSEIANSESSVYIVEKNEAFGQETSSRNSEVIHSGIYYEKDSFKANMCISGNILLYEICEKHRIPFHRTGKLIVSTNSTEEPQLRELFEKGKSNGVSRLRILSKEQVKELEPNVNALSAIYSPDTGIIDSHKLMEYFITAIKEKGADIIYGSKVVALKKSNFGYQVDIKDGNGEIFSVLANKVINSAGLNSDEIAQMVGMNIYDLGYNLKYCKGQYFRIASSKKCALIKRLIYPVPKMEKGGLGIHVTVDMAGSLRLGPDTAYMNNNIIDYGMDISQSSKFYKSAVQFLPFLEEADLVPDLCGIRPKLQGENETFCDFVIQEESANGYPGFINLIGIESPGLTASISIAKYVKTLVNR